MLYLRIGPAGTTNAASTNTPISGRVYGVTAVTETGAVLFNPDFTQESDSTPSFVDTAATPNTWSMFGAAFVEDTTLTAAGPGLFASNDLGGAASSPATGWCLSDLFYSGNGQSSVTAHQSVTDPAGGTTASTLSFPATGSSGYAYVTGDTASPPGTGVHAYQVWLRGHAGGEKVLITVGDSSSANLQSNTIQTLTTSWKRFSYTTAISSGASKATKMVIGAGASNAAMTIDAAFARAA